MSYLSTETLLKIGSEIKKPSAGATLKDCVRNLYESEEYQSWKNSGTETKDTFELKSDFQIPTLFKELELVKDGRLQVKINSIRDDVFLTDGVWVPKENRVFPFSDESEVLIEYCENNLNAKWIKDAVIVDLATGCGHNALALKAGSFRYGFDVNPRALAYFQINSTLNGFAGATSAVRNDIQNGIPAIVASTKPILFLANMPFAPSPHQGALALTSDGGERGSFLINAALHAIKDFFTDQPHSRPARAVFLCLTVGRESENRWDVVDTAIDLFGAAKVKWSILRDHKMLRVNGLPDVVNPSPLSHALDRFVDCQLYFENSERAAYRSLYRDLVSRLKKDGFSDLAFGALEIGIQNA